MNEPKDAVEPEFIYELAGRMPMTCELSSFPTNLTYDMGPVADEPTFIYRDDKSALDEQRFEYLPSGEETLIAVPTALLPEIRRLLAAHRPA